MIDDLLKLVRDSIYLHTGLPVVDTDDPFNRPNYPFYSYKVTSYIPERHYGIFTETIAGEDVSENLALQPTLVLSFNAYDKELNIANTKAMTAWEWFKFIGVPTLKQNDFVVTDVTAVYDRTIELGENYEYRYGFDVMLRTLHVISRTAPTIETYEINKGE